MAEAGNMMVHGTAFTARPLDAARRVIKSDGQAMLMAGNHTVDALAQLHPQFHRMASFTIFVRGVAESG